MKKRLLAAVMSLCMIVSLLPVSALAAPESDSGVVFTKNAMLDEQTGDVTITMEAYATGEEVEIPGKSTPLDIVLVLDQSGSMAYDFDGESTYNNTERRQYAMKQAVKAFVDEVADNASTNDLNNEVQHNIGIVTFGNNSNQLVGLTDAESGKDTIKGSIDSLPNSPSGATRVDLGIAVAKQMLDTAQNDGKEKVVIVFTDGVPTTSSNFSTDVANGAIKTAQQMKQNGVTVYTVGIFNGVDPTETHGDKWDYAVYDDVPCNGNPGSYWGGSYVAGFFGSNDFDAVDVPAGNRFLNYLSSNYENAEGIGVTKGTYDPGDTLLGVGSGTGYRIDANAEQTGDSYYLTAADAESLNNVFSTIAGSIGSTANTSLDSETVVKDVVSQYYTAPADAGVKVYTQAYRGNNQWAERVDVTNDVAVNVEGQTVTVTGYDYAANYVSQTMKQDGSYGTKLVIEFVVKPTATASSRAQIPTNTSAEILVGSTQVATAAAQPITGNQLSYDANLGGLTGFDAEAPDAVYYAPGCGEITLSGDGVILSTTTSGLKPSVTFVGWSSDDTYSASNPATVSVETIDTVSLTGDTTVYAVWAKDENGNGEPDYEEDKYTVTYTDGVDGEEVFADQKHEGLFAGTNTPAFNMTGIAADKNGNPARQDYVFVGWNPSVAEKVEGDNLQITYTATWAEDKNNNDTPDSSEDKYSVTYTDGVDGEEVFADQKHEGLFAGANTPAFNMTGITADKNGNPARQDYVFISWNPTVAEKVEGDNLQITYTATWAEDKNNNDIPDDEEIYTIHVDFGKYAEDGHTWTSFEKAALTSNATAPLTPPTEKAQQDAQNNGMAFVGWKAPNGNMITSFDYGTLAAIVGENWSPDNEAWINIEAVYEEAAKAITLKFDNGDGTWSDGFDDSQTRDVTYTSGDEVIGAIPEVTAPENEKLSYWVTDDGVQLAPEALNGLTYAEAVQLFGISEGDVELTAVYEPVSVSITVQFVDVVTGEQVGGPYTMDVSVGTTQINTYRIPGEWIPDGYEVAQAGDVNIEDGVATVKVRRIAPTDDELKAYLWELQVDCSTEGHDPIQTGLLPDSYTTKGDGLGIQGNVYVIQLSTEPYVQKYIEAGYSQEHTSVSGDTMLLYLTHDGNKWIAPEDPTVMLNCEPVYTIHAAFVKYVDDKDVPLGGGDAISTMPEKPVDVPDPESFTPEGQTFEGWQVRLGASPMYTDGFTYNDLYALMQENNVSFYEHEATITFVAVFKEAVKTINVSFVDEDGVTSLGGGDVISTDPDRELEIADPTAPAGKTFVGWKAWIGASPMYEGKFTYSDLSQLDLSWYENKASVTFQAVYADEYHVIHLNFVDGEGNSIGSGDVISTYPNQEYVTPDPASYAPEGQTFVGWKAQLGNEPMYNGAFTFAALEDLREELDGPITWVNGEETWITFEAIYTDEEAEYRVIHVSFVDSDETTSLGGGDVISTYPNQELTTPDPVNFTPDGKTFAGWKAWVNGEPMYNGEFTYEALLQLLDSGFYGEEAWLTFEAVYTDEKPSNSYTVTFYAGKHGSLSGTTQFEINAGSSMSGSGYDVPRVDANSKYSFTGWLGSDGRTYTSNEVRNLTINSNMTFTAQYKSTGGSGGGGGGSETETYAVYYHSNYGSDERKTGGRYEENDEVEVRDNDWWDRDNYRFLGWNTEEDGSGRDYDPEDTFDMPDEDVHLYAQWRRTASDPSDSGTDRWLETQDHRLYMVGYPDDTFGPDRNMTRAEVAQMFYALLLDQNVSYTENFSDVPSDAWYAEAVNTLAALGMIDGYPDGTFRPDATITRAEFCVIALAFAYEPESFDCSFYDVSVNDWFYDYVAQATSYGWISGGSGAFRPNDAITRAEVSVIVNNMLGRVADEDYVDRHEDELTTFPDVTSSYWAYYSIMETTNSHDYTKSNGTENWR